jgi:putative ABC transport system permease protein
MPERAIHLTYGDVMTAAALVLVAGCVSLGFALGLERRLAFASLRTVVQLLLIGYVLRWVFAVENVLVVLPILVLMTLAASRAAVQRIQRRYDGLTTDAFITLLFCGFVVTFFAANGIVGIDPWYDPRYVIPLLGMVLGNGLTGISLCLDDILERLETQRSLVEEDLAAGATRWEAARDPLRESVRRGMVPIINSMSVVGIVSLPGMMTGQILAGESPLEAVKYQIMIMFMIAAATSLGCMGAVLIAFRRLFNDRHQLRVDRIRWRG